MYSSCYASGGAGAGHLSGGVSRSISCGRYYSYTVQGGQSYGHSSIPFERLFMGSGGGGGARDSHCCGLPGRGGNGGGIIIIYTPFLTGDGGLITACGVKGQDSGKSLYKTGGIHGAGGGGSGGSIVILASSYSSIGVVNVDVEGGRPGTSLLSSRSNGRDGSQGQQITVSTAQLGLMYSFWI